MSCEEDLKAVCDFLMQDWPAELREQTEKSFRPVPEVFRTLIAAHVRTLMDTTKKKWHAFCVVGRTYESFHGGTYQNVIEGLFHFMFPGRKFLKDCREMFRVCVESMLERDDVYLELFFRLEP